MRFGFLGPLAVWTDEGTPVHVPGLKVRALLADLLLHQVHVSTGRLIDDLWGEDLPANPEGALQSKVSQLRGVLEGAEPGGRDLVRYLSDGYVLHVDPAAVDRTEFETLVRRAREMRKDDPRRAVALLDQALAVWRGPPLAEFAGHLFARPTIAELDEARLSALEDRIEARIALGEHSAVMGELDRLVREHPLRERLRGHHMRALYGAGRQAEALASFQQLRARLADELGIDPGAEVSGLYTAILNQDASLDVPTPVTRSGRPCTNLPSVRTRIVGREEAVARVRHLLANRRLLTLTGTGGVGKTRLALEVAASLLDQNPDGVWVVELAAPEQRSGEEMAWVTEQVAAVLGVQDDPSDLGDGRPALIDRIAVALEQQGLLLVLDNCDHVVEPVARLAHRLLSAAPGLRILATSRRPLGLSDEQLWPVAPLAVPDKNVHPLPQHIARFAAVELFAQRAGAADPDFAITAENAAAVATICRRLDGLPLALELAAARVRALPVHDLAAGLDDRLRLLSTGAADAPARQQTLTALVDWSWALLTAPERAVLRRLSVFANGATQRAAEAVCAGDGVDVADVLRLLVSLVDHSLVVVDRGQADTRYRLLDTIRTYGLDRLDEAGELDRTRLCHARFYAGLAETGDARLRTGDQQVWLERFDAEAADVRAAVRWAASHGDGLALRLTGSMAWYWYLRGRQGEASRLLRCALEEAGSDAPSSARATVRAWLGALGSLEKSAGDPAEHRRAAFADFTERDGHSGLAYARLLLGGLLRPWAEVDQGTQLIDEALETFVRAKDRWGIAAALSVRGWLALGRGDLDVAVSDGTQARALFIKEGDRWGEVRAVELLGQVAEIRGDYVQATELHRAALKAAEALGLWAAAVHELSRLGRLAALTGDHGEAIALHQRALRLARELSLDQGIAFAQVGLGLIARRQGMLDEAEAHFRAVLDWHLERDFHAGTALCLTELGFVAELRGEPERAHALHLRALEAARRGGDLRAVVHALEGSAGAAAARGAAETAAMLLGASATARERTGAHLPPGESGDFDRIAAIAVAQLGHERYATSVEAGSALDLPAAVQLAKTAGRPSPHQRWSQPTSSIESEFA